MSTSKEISSTNDKKLQRIVAAVRKEEAKAKTANRESLERYCAIGGKLSEAKELVPHGTFGEWIEANLGFTRVWASKLVRLHKHWGSFEEVEKDRANQNDPLTASDYTVSGALKLVVPSKKKLSATVPAIQAEETAMNSAADEEELRAKLQKAQTEIEETREWAKRDALQFEERIRELSDAKEKADARVKELEAENAALRAALTDKAKAVAEQPISSPSYETQM